MNSIYLKKFNKMIPFKVMNTSDVYRIDFVLSSLSLLLCSVFVNDPSDGVSIKPSTNTDAQTYINGHLITEPIQLHHVSKVILSNYLYIVYYISSHKSPHPTLYPEESLEIGFEEQYYVKHQSIFVVIKTRSKENVIFLEWCCAAL